METARQKKEQNRSVIDVGFLKPWFSGKAFQTMQFMNIFIKNSKALGIGMRQAYFASFVTIENFSEVHWEIFLFLISVLKQRLTV